MYHFWIEIYLTCLLFCVSNSVYDYYEGDFDEDQDYNDIDTTTKSSTLSNKKESEGNLINLILLVFVILLNWNQFFNIILYYDIKVKPTLIRSLTKFWSSLVRF